MFKHVLALIVLSVLVVIFKTELAVLLHWIIDLHQHMLTWLGSVFSSDKIGVVAQHALALLIIPVLASAIVALALWILRRKMIPFLPEAMWVVWLLLVALVTVGQGNS